MSDTVANNCKTHAIRGVVEVFTMEDLVIFARQGNWRILGLRHFGDGVQGIFRPPLSASHTYLRTHLDFRVVVWFLMKAPIFSLGRSERALLYL